MNDRRVGPWCGILGAILLFAGTWLHPMNADPNAASAAFTEYAASHYWIAIHLMQLAGVALIAAALLILAQKMTAGAAIELAYLGAAGAVASLAAAAALQAVDGVALKAMVDNWASAAEADKRALFYAAFGVRQIEIGLAAITSMLFGFTASIYGIAMLVDGRYPKAFSILAIAGGAATILAGVAIAYTGFSALAMNLNLSASAILLLWIAGLGLYDLTHRASHARIGRND
jgi:hypothetical protein